MANGHGGKRAGAGRPHGTKNENTVEKAAARELVRQMITEHLEPMIRAQIANACGVQHFFLRDPSTGQFKRIPDPDEIEAALNAENASEGSTYWIFTQNPNVQAFSDLLNRAIDRPTEQVQVTGDGSPIVIRWQGGGYEKESGEVRELPDGDVDDRIRHARKVNGHAEPNREAMIDEIICEDCRESFCLLVTCHTGELSRARHMRAMMSFQFGDAGTHQAHQVSGLGALKTEPASS